MKVHVDDDRHPCVEVPVRVCLEPAFAVRPASVFFGLVPSGGSREVVLVVSHKSGARVAVGDVQSSDPRVVVSIAPGGKVRVRLSAEPPLGRVSGEISMETRSPAAKSVVVPFLGVIQRQTVAKE